MRLVNKIITTGLLAIVAGLGAYGCSSETDTSNPGAGGGTQGCDPTAKCTSVTSECVALADNSATATTASLRMSQLTITKPAALAEGLVASIVGSSVVMKNADCRLNGTGLFSWLLQFDLSAKTLTTGGAPPVADPNDGYCFVSGPTLGTDVAPTVLPAEISADGSFSATAGADQVITVPIFLDAAATSGVLLQLHAAKISGGKLTSDNNCIGSYNGDQFSRQDKCAPVESEGQTYFSNGANLDAYILADEADAVLIDTLSKSLCALLVDSADTEVVDKITHCKKGTDGKVTAKGDWCSTTNAAATADCADAFSLGASFAASAVKINGTCN